MSAPPGEAAESREEQRWLWDTRPRTAAATATLVLLPHSGGSAQGYSDWARWLPSDVRVVAAQYPGRGARYGQTPATDIAALADPLAEVLAGLDTPVHVFGHSLGALVGFEVCWRLQRAGRPAAAFHPSAAAAAHVHRAASTSPTELTDDELLALLKERGGVPEDLLLEPDLMDLVMDACRTDMAVTDSYSYGGADRRLDCPVVAFGGDRDSAVPVDRLERWRELTTGTCEVHVLSGGHFYLHDHMATVTAVVRQHLKERRPL
ncbi:alpha/beta fold hydrolase [Streptomyces sp. NPDC047117]|uniref:thioesterase II family protein n=1 Tax=Streptomyces sp. NPDC047117 TaxID=3155379 RepID=UPI0034097305